MTDTTKEKFEAWARVNRLPINRIVNGERYVSMETEWAWRAWVSKDAQLAAPVAAQSATSAQPRPGQDVAPQLLAALVALEAAIYVHEEDCSYRVYNDFNFQQVWDAIAHAKGNRA